MPAQYMFQDIPNIGKLDRLCRLYRASRWIKFGIERALTRHYDDRRHAIWRHGNYRDRFLFDVPVNPNLGMDEIRRVQRLHAEYGMSAISVSPFSVNPQVPINDKKMYPYLRRCAWSSTCRSWSMVGVPGPRVPMAAQKVELIDEVCWFFPELKFIMRHGAEPWEELAVKLMLKYPNLYYSTSAFAPKHYPKAIINYANTRGADKIMYAGYYPMGLVARPHLQRAAGCAFQGPCLAEIFA